MTGSQGNKDANMGKSEGDPRVGNEEKSYDKCEGKRGSCSLEPFWRQVQKFFTRDASKIKDGARCARAQRNLCFGRGNGLRANTQTIKQINGAVINCRKRKRCMRKKKIIMVSSMARL